MSDLHPLNLVALAAKIDAAWLPSLEQVIVFTKNLAHICALKPQQLPEKPFERRPCPSSDPEDLDEGIEREGIDFLGLYEPKKIRVTLCVCRIRNFASRHGFHLDDVIKIVLIHELAHFVTHLGMSKSQVYWNGFCKAESETQEEFAQEATYLLLKVADYGHLVHAFDSLSNHCPPKYNKWRQTWKQQLKKKNNSDAVLSDFQARNLQLRPSFAREDIIDLPSNWEE